MAGRYGSADATISIDDSAGGSPQVVTGFVNSDYAIKIRAGLEETTGFGLADEEHTPTGVKGADPITFEGYWNTTTVTGPHVVFLTPDDGPQDATRTVVLGFGDSKIVTFESRLSEYEVMGVVKNLTKFKATIQPTGTVVWS